MPTIRRRLLVRLIVCVLAIFGVISLAAHLTARHESEEFFSARLASSARILQALLANQLETATVEQPIDIEIPRGVPESGGPTRFGHPYEHKIAFQVWRADGKLLARSATAPGQPLGAFTAGYSSRTIDDDVWQVFALRSGQVWIFVAEKDEVREEMVEELGTSVLIPVIVGGIALLLTVNLVLASTLAPLRTLADNIARRAPDSLSPVDLPEVPGELALVVDELNSLLRRMREAFQREQRFIDAAAHELRTPLTAVQLHVQNALQAGDDDGERARSLDEALCALRRTIHLAEQLLTFSRLASGTDLLRHEPVVLADVCRGVMQMQRPLLERKGQSARLAAPDDAVIDGDPYRLQQLVRNLVDNASLHGAALGVIDIDVARHDGTVVLRVANDGAPVPEAEAAQVFTPYYRRDGKADFGAGLGLSIVHEIAKQHGAAIHLGAKPDGQGCVVSIAFAAARDGGTADPDEAGAHAAAHPTEHPDALSTHRQ
ncbi:sensor histidine kinase [Pseudoduganella flava]|uniref:histidine kinase n=1 Tax=Pseudoduganella flava TaxID=871742 RepID=A0ABX6G0K5_9BURK|nr:sensor histidine kinase [Pseudoduganella flava]